MIDWTPPPPPPRRSKRRPADPHNYQYCADPLKLQRVLWPDLRFYDRQIEVIYSVAENRETIVHAGNMLGKDFVAAFITLWFFLTRKPVRIVTTSVDGTQLEGVLWGEIRRLIETAARPLTAERGGPIVNNHLHLKKVYTNGPEKGRECGLSYCIGRVAAKGEGMLGHHIAQTGDGVARTLFVADEASGVDDVSWDRAETWANRKLAIGNPYPCSNFFYRAVEGGPRADGGVEPGGDLVREDGTFYRKVIHVKGEDSPNVQLALKTERYGGVPSGEIVLPGVLPWSDYQDRRRNWDKVRQCIGLDGLFWKGADALLFPPDWLDRAGRIARALRGRVRRAEAIGVDPGEGEANTAMVAVDRWGVIELFSAPTPDTDEVPRQVLAFMRRHGLDRGDGPSKVYFDRGGGGKQHADRMRASGYNVQTVGFGEAVVPPPRPGVVPAGELRDARESKYAYENRRAEMYGLLSELLNPAREVTSEGVDGEGGTGEPVGFGLPDEYGVLRQQLAPIPRLLSEEGRLYLPPKNRKPGDRNKSKKTLTELVGRSPDEADALVLAVYGMIRRPRPASAGGFY